jgi:acetoin utilization deacetylase AcuC-like enzyme
VPAAPFVYSARYEADIGSHVFPTWKYRRVRERLLEAGLAGPRSFVAPESRPRGLLALVHERGYLEDLFALRSTPRILSSELPLSEEIALWFETACFGSMTASALAVRRGGAMHIGGGFHHAFADRAEGFCYLNDTAVAARVALGDGADPALVTAAGDPVTRISVIDLDVHQGNGTARIFQGDDRVFTFSMHQENNYPVKQRGDLDLGLPDGMGDEPYLGLLDGALERTVLSRRPHLVYYLAGADPFHEDVLGGLALTLEGLRERDRRVFAACREVGAAVVVLLAGGYAADRDDTSLIHFHTAAELLAHWPTRGPAGGAKGGNP